MLKRKIITALVVLISLTVSSQTITEEGQWMGLKNSKGKIILENKYKEVVNYRTFCRYTDVYSYAMNGKHGIICHPDSSGYTDSGLIYDSVYYKHNCIMIMKDGKYTIVYELRENIFRCGTPRYDSIIPMFTDYNPENSAGIKHYYTYQLRELNVKIGSLWAIADYHSDSLLAAPRWKHPFTMEDGVWTDRIVRDSNLAVIILPRTGTEVKTTWMFEAVFDAQKSFIAVYSKYYEDSPQLRLQIWDTRTGQRTVGYDTYASLVDISYCGGTTLLIKEEFREAIEWKTKDETKYTFVNFTSGYVLYTHTCVKEENLRWDNEKNIISVYSRKHYNAYTEKFETSFSAL
jgi:hypothetical protein